MSPKKTIPNRVPGDHWSLYIAECADGSYYTGIAKDVEKRIETHNNGKGAKYTAARGPVRLLFQESQADYSAALRREYQVKRLSKNKKILFAQGEKLRRPTKKSKMTFQRKKNRKTKANAKTPRKAILDKYESSKNKKFEMSQR